MQVQVMDQNSFLLDAIDREVIKSWAYVHHQKSLPGKDIMLKATQSFLMNICELYVTYWSLSEEVSFSVVRKIS